MFIPTPPLIWLLPLVVFEVIFKGIALWKAARHGQRNWFVVLLVVNTVGILPIIYLKFFQKKYMEQPSGVV